MRGRKTEEIRQRQDEAKNATVFILKEFGPTSFLIQDERGRNYKLQIGGRHECSCGSFKSTGEPCLHIYWIMLKKFKVDADDPVSWQPGLVEREIVDLLDGKHSQSIEITPKRAEANSPEIFKTENGVLKQRLIGAGDICPICQDELLSEKRNPVTYCRKGCGNSVHIRCMRVWTDHQRREKTIGLSEVVPCPVCRGEFGPLGLLIHESTKDVTDTGVKSSRNAPMTVFPAVQPLQRILRPAHSRTVCLSCQCTPVYGNLYRCQACLEQSVEEGNTYLCSECFKNNEHGEHDRFMYKEDPQGKWTMVAPNRCVPVNLGFRLDESQVLPTTGNRANGGWHRTTTDTMRLQDLSLLPHWVIRRPRHQTGEFRHFERLRCKMRTSNNTWQMSHQTDDGKLSNGNQIAIENGGLVKTTGLLAPGRQCRLCLMVYQVGQSVRRLQPGCQHIFHAACIDPWLLHRSSTCPLDGIHVTPLASVSKESPLGENYIHSRTTAILPEIQGVKLNASDFRIHMPKPAPRAKLLTSPRKRIAATSGKPSASFEHNLSVVGQGVTASTAHPELGSVGIRKPTQDTFGVENAKFYTNDR